MVTSLQNEKRLQFVGLSTDTKPTKEDTLLENGAVFIEMDTSKVFLYNKDAETWIQFTGNCVFAIR